MKELVFSLKEKNIKAVLVEKSGNSYDVLAAGAVELAPGSIEAGNIRNIEEVKTKLQGLIQGLGSAKPSKISILLSEEAGFLKVLPQNKESSLLQDTKVQEEVPFPIKGSFTTLRLLKNKNIQLVAAPKDLIFAYQKLFKELGLEIESILLEPVIFLPLFHADKPTLVIAADEGGVLFSVVFESGIFLSTTKYFKDGVFDAKKLLGWIEEIVEAEIKDISPKLDFEVLVFGDHEQEIYSVVSEKNIPVKTLDVSFRKIIPKISNIADFKKLIICAGLSKQIPGFHMKGVGPSKAVQTASLPKINYKLVGLIIAGIFLLIGAIWTTPKIVDNYLFPDKEIADQAGSTPTISTKSADTTSSAKTNNDPKQATKAAEKNNKPAEEPKPVLKRSSLRIEVLNGNGVVGSAGEAVEFLKSKGYKVPASGNAANYNFSKTEIRIKKSKSDFYPLLTKDLSSRYTIIKGATLPESSSVDAQVIIGKE